MNIASFLIGFICGAAFLLAFLWAMDRADCHD
jgi:hypothetical protein